MMITSLFDINYILYKLFKYIEHYYPECVVSDCIQLKKENEELKVQLKEKEQNLKDIETNILSLF